MSRVCQVQNAPTEVAHGASVALPWQSPYTAASVLHHARRDRQAKTVAVVSNTDQSLSRNEIELPDLSAVDWRTAATTMASDLRAAFGRLPWLVQAFGSQVFYGPGKARHDDHSLALSEGAGFSGVEAGQAMATVFMFVLGSAVGESASVRLRRQLRRDGGNPDELIRAAMVEATDVAMRFQGLRAPRARAGRRLRGGAGEELRIRAAGHLRRARRAARRAVDAQCAVAELCGRCGRAAPLSIKRLGAAGTAKVVREAAKRARGGG
jgi:hypothetical protein